MTRGRRSKYADESTKDGDVQPKKRPMESQQTCTVLITSTLEEMRREKERVGIIRKEKKNNL